MKRHLAPFLFASMVAVLAVGGSARAADAPEPSKPKIPADAVAANPVVPGKPVSFAKDVKVLLAHNCYECHAKGKKKGGFALDTRESTLKGGENGPAVIVGKADESDLIKRLTTDDEDLRMPPKGPGLKPAEVAVLKAWVDQGLKWDEINPAEVAAKKPQNLVARRPVLPGGDGGVNSGHPVDRLLAPYLTANKVAASQVPDDVFARRAYLDIVGLPPTPEQLVAFIADKSPDKRDALVRALLADNKAYADHWMTFWQDHLRDGKKDIGSTDIFKPVTGWLHAALVNNKPYDRFVADLLVAKIPPDQQTEAQISGLEKDRAQAMTNPDDAEGFLLGQLSGLERPRGDQAWQVQAAQNIGQVFLGVQLKCATCHDSFIDQWTMLDSWSLANVFATKPLEAVRCEQPTGKFYEARFLYPEMGKIDPKAAVAERQKQLAALLTSPSNGRFSRTVVNRIWTRLMGRGLVVGVDEMDAEAWSPDVLDWLAEDFVEHGYDLKHLIGRIVTSGAYQMPTVDEATATPNPDAKYVFRGPSLRRLSAEQFVDAVQAMLGRDVRAWRGGGTRLMDMLGRPDHRVVVTHRDHKSSTIQALELLNGQSLYDILYTDGTVRKATANNAAAVKNPAAEIDGDLALAGGGGSAMGPAATKPTTKPATAPAPASPATKPTTKPVAKSTTKPATKPVAKATTKPTTKPAVAKAAAGSKVNAQAAALAKMPPKDLAGRLIQHGLGRAPAEKEVAILAEVLGERPTPESVADAVWMVAMLPEFQLVR